MPIPNLHILCRGYSISLISCHQVLVIRGNSSLVCRSLNRNPAQNIVINRINNYYVRKNKFFIPYLRLGIKLSFLTSTVEYFAFLEGAL